ncbi:unknown protein [Oryza sativa Japonica Group]|uniref:Os01g0553000 protein n=1 Tax=Oryza sativa subsp. japonica TaxID=39947 RepID=Q5JKM8_ORYSJ|nr:unknown protein [Oryza sativa Japonica Group]BAH91143.1 Os01g0553000 [Oryza sativa Japonica Group]|eukprot:NP_001172413.1 Os01g0553000 [Oryza sativa Japonica Group]
MPAAGRSLSPEPCRPSPRATTFASMRQIHSPTFPFLFPSEISHHRRHFYRPKLSSYCRRSGRFNLPLYQPPTSPSARRPGTQYAADVAALWPLEARRPARPFLSLSLGS